MSAQREEDHRVYLFVEGYVEARITKGDRRKYGYPENGLPPVRLKSENLESSFAVALRNAEAGA